MSLDDIILKPRALVVDCIIGIPEVHNKHSKNKEGFSSQKEPFKGPFRPTKTIPVYSNTIKKRVELMNKEMLSKNLPYRYDIQPREGSLSLNMTVLGPQGEALQRHTKEVTSNNYKTLLDNMQTGRGFIFDD